MNDDIFEMYHDAGVIAAKILNDGAQGIRIGAYYLDIVESIEEQVREEGAELAFPLNLSLNEDAAHDTASPGDDRVFAKGDVVKLDLGVQIGCADTNSPCTAVEDFRCDYSGIMILFKNIVIHTISSSANAVKFSNPVFVTTPISSSRTPPVPG